MAQPGWHWHESTCQNPIRVGDSDTHQSRPSHSDGRRSSHDALQEESVALQEDSDLRLGTQPEILPTPASNLPPSPTTVTPARQAEAADLDSSRQPRQTVSNFCNFRAQNVPFGLRPGAQL